MKILPQKNWKIIEKEDYLKYAVMDLEFITVRKDRKLYFGLVWKKPSTVISTMSNTIIGVEENFEQFVKEIQIEYRLDNSPIIE